MLPASDDRYDAQLPALPGRQQQPGCARPSGRAVRAVGRRGFGLLAGQRPTAVHDVVDQTQLLIAGEPLGVRARPGPGPVQLLGREPTTGWTALDPRGASGVVQVAAERRSVDVPAVAFPGRLHPHTQGRRQRAPGRPQAHGLAAMEGARRREDDRGAELVPRDVLAAELESPSPRPHEQAG